MEGHNQCFPDWFHGVTVIGSYIEVFPLLRFYFQWIRVVNLFLLRYVHWVGLFAYTYNRRQCAGKQASLPLPDIGIK